MKKRLFLFTLVVSTMLSFSACSSDDNDEEPNGTLSGDAPVQITVVFEPNQLGDQGYADRILKGLQQIEKADEADGENNIDVRYISLTDENKTRQAVEQWSNTRTNSYKSQTPYERRLLVLTKATQAEWLNSLYINENDEVLLLNSDKSIAEISTLGNRIHTLNISAYASVKKYFKYVDQMESSELAPFTEMVGLIRFDEKQLFADSISEAFHDYYGDTKELEIVNFDEERGDESNITTASYRLAYSYSDYEAMGFYFSIIDLGTANLGYDYYLFNNEQEIERALLLDAETSNLLPRFCICRKFDKALIDWVTRWATGEIGSMPQTEWHGMWDGYTEDDING